MIEKLEVRVLSTSFSRDHILREELQSLGDFLHIKFNEEGRKYKGPETVDVLKDADIAIIGLEQITMDVVRQCPSLKLLSKYGVGIDNIDISALNDCNIKLGWTPGVNKRSVSEMTLAFMISLMRNLYPTSLLLKNGEWKKDGGALLSGKTVGIIGMGNIGSDLIQLLKPFGCRVLANDIVDKSSFYKEHGIIEATKEQIYRESDVVTVHVPKTKETTNMLTKREMQMMKPHAFVINTARGGIINEQDLYEVLTEKVVAGAALDAYLEEPPTDLKLLELDNVFCTPHIGGNAREAVLAMGRSAIEHIREFINVQ